MRKFILDTDIGADCDDVAAIYYLLGKMNDGECEVSAVTLCTARKYASSATKAFLADNGFSQIQIGAYKGKPLVCDEWDNYALAIANGCCEECEDAITLKRKVLSENDKTDIICIGPMCNVANLLKSGADEYSCKTGVELVRERAGKLYLMGGAFEFAKGEKPFAEWNIEQDIESARAVFEMFPNEIIVCPFESGAKIATRLSSTGSLLKKSMEVFFRSVDEKGGNEYVENPERTRPSWDPLTCMVALGESDYVCSESGTVRITETGITKFNVEPNGKHRYLSADNDFATIEKRLNEYLKNLWRKR